METKLPKFEATIGWLKKAMELHGLDSSFIEDDDCWEELGEKKDLVSKEFLVEARQAIVASESGHCCYQYLLNIDKEDEEVRQALIASGPKNGWACYDYLLNIDKEDEEVKQALIDSEDGWACYCYLLNIDKEDEEVKQALIDSEDGYACYRYLLNIDREDGEVRQVALAEGYPLGDL